jgi:hypothetical protein
MPILTEILIVLLKMGNKFNLTRLLKNCQNQNPQLRRSPDKVVRLVNFLERVSLMILKIGKPKCAINNGMICIVSRAVQIMTFYRVFTGDQRPSMMARAHRSSTLIDPATLHAKPQPLNSSRSPGAQQAADRRASQNIKPLLNFDGDEQPLKTSLATDTRISNTRSVFGVDTIWEREMVKLREIEAQEKIEADEMQKREEAKQNRKQKSRGKKKKGKSKDDVPERTQDPSTAEPHIDAPRVSAEPPILPSIPKATTRRRRRPFDDNDDNESSSSAESAEIPQPPSSHRRDEEAQLWVAGSSDEDDREPRRTTGVGPRYPRARQNEDSEEDLPLSVAMERVVQRATRRMTSSDGSDEEKPLSVLLQKAKLSLPSINSNNSPNSKQGAVDDDDQPLGLRASKVLSSPQVFGPMQEQEQDDDRPLAFHPEQQRRTQYQMLAQHQQMMMQAQLHNSMFFGAPPAMMGSGFFAQPMAAPLMMPPQIPIPSPPPSHDAAKFSQVDRWRRDVAVDGKP